MGQIFCLHFKKIYIIKVALRDQLQFRFKGEDVPCVCNWKPIGQYVLAAARMHCADEKGDLRRKNSRVRP